MKRKALGKGMGALIREKSTRPEARVQPIPLSQIKPSPGQPRKQFDPEKLKELAASIATCGVILPILVRPTAGGYELVAGERRFRAASIAGLTEIPAIIRNIADSEALEMTLIENLQREDLNPIEAANGYRLLQDEYRMTQDDIAARVGKKRSTVTNTLRLLKLPNEIQREIITGNLSMGHAKALLAAPHKKLMLDLAGLTIREGWSVRTLEDKISTLNSPKKSAETRQPVQDPILLSAVDQLRRRFATKIAIQPRRKGGGKVVLEYYSDDDLARLLEILGGGQP